MGFRSKQAQKLHKIWTLGEDAKPEMEDRPLLKSVAFMDRLRKEIKKARAILGVKQKMMTPSEAGFSYMTFHRLVKKHSVKVEPYFAMLQYFKIEMQAGGQTILDEQRARELIKETRAALGMNIDLLAELSGYSCGESLANFLRGDFGISVERMVDTFEALGHPVALVVRYEVDDAGDIDAG